MSLADKFNAATKTAVSHGDTNIAPATPLDFGPTFALLSEIELAVLRSRAKKLWKKVAPLRKCLEQLAATNAAQPVQASMHYRREEQSR